MKWRVGKTPKRDYTEWHIWFAWYPVQIKNHMHWLCLLNRRAKFSHMTDLDKQKEVIRSGQDFYWEYVEPVYYP